MVKVYNIGVKEYNSYLVCGEINIIIDTVPQKFFNEFKNNIEKYVPVSEIKYVVFGRTTPDASGCALDLLSENSNIEFFATVAGLKNLKEITNTDFKENVIKNEDKLDLGSDNLLLFVAPNLSWPDTAFFCLENEKALFSENLFCDSPEENAFQNVFLKRAVEQIKQLDVLNIFPAYGEFSGMERYDKLFDDKKHEEIAVIFESQSGQTELMAKTVADELKACGKNVALLNARNLDADALAHRLEACKAICFGTNTVNHNAGRNILNVITGINVLKISEKRAFVFGSYGWSGEGVNIIMSLISNLKMKPYKKAFRIIFNPSEEKLDELRKEVRRFAEDI